MYICNSFRSSFSTKEERAISITTMLSHLLFSKLMLCLFYQVGQLSMLWWYKKKCVDICAEPSLLGLYILTQHCYRNKSTKKNTSNASIGNWSTSMSYWTYCILLSLLYIIVISYDSRLEREVRRLVHLGLWSCTVRVHVYVRNLRSRVGASMYVVCMYTYVSSIRHSDNMNSV